MQSALPHHSPVFESYWRFAAERQQVWLRRLSGDRGPLTNDPVIANYRFTNTYRVLDRVSQYMLRHVVYDGPHSPQDMLLRLLFFKIFNRIGTWEQVTAEYGTINTASFDVGVLDKVLTSIRERGGRVYSNAYITPPIRGVEGPKHLGHLLWLEQVLNDGLERDFATAKSLGEVYERLTRYDGFGPFLAYQFAVDVAYTPLTTATEDDFMVPGPGAMDGVAKCFPGSSKHDATRIIYDVCAEQDDWFERYGIAFPGLLGRRLRPIDCQNLFCEISKYARVAHPAAVGSLGRTRIKQTYQRNPASMPPLFLPPKWGIETSTPGRSELLLAP